MQKTRQMKPSITQRLALAALAPDGRYLLRYHVLEEDGRFVPRMLTETRTRDAMLHRGWIARHKPIGGEWAFVITDAGRAVIAPAAAADPVPTGE